MHSTTLKRPQRDGKDTNLASALRSYGVVFVSIRRFDEFNEFLLPMDAEFLVDVNDVRVNRILGDKTTRRL